MCHRLTGGGEGGGGTTAGTGRRGTSALGVGGGGGDALHHTAGAVPSSCVDAKAGSAIAGSGSSGGIPFHLPDVSGGSGGGSGFVADIPAGARALRGGALNSKTAGGGQQQQHVSEPGSIEGEHVYRLPEAIVMTLQRLAATEPPSTAEDLLGFQHAVAQVESDVAGVRRRYLTDDIQHRMKASQLKLKLLIEQRHVRRMLCLPL
jgi:hypothetical protein